MFEKYYISKIIFYNYSAIKNTLGLLINVIFIIA